MAEIIAQAKKPVFSLNCCTESINLKIIDDQQTRNIFKHDNFLINIHPFDYINSLASLCHHHNQERNQKLCRVICEIFDDDMM